jgi:hyperosmotically inducible periplasmic protein
MRLLLVRSVLVALAVLVSACSTQQTEDSSRNRERQLAADNTGKNAEERAQDMPSVMQQGETGPDLATTQTIRQALVADKTLSMNGKNVKVITLNGEVALRGPVENVTEKATIRRIAEQTAGVSRVIDLLEVKGANGN